ncbi:MAG TPA: hypothetical protein VFS00_09015 [Polyangiaceae bacterium]|nr:hypothetical protein [Polyangiaceae bacterium]
MALALGPSAGCTPERQNARLSDATVVAAGKAGGGLLDRPRPSTGKPLAEGLPPASACVPGDSLLRRLGPTCDDHESEGAAPPANEAGDLPPGLPPPARQVRWYCSERMVVRVVFESCATTPNGALDGITPVEIGVATHGAGEKK